MLRLTTKILTRKFSSINQSIIKLPTTTNDISNSLGYLNTTDIPTMTLFQKLSNFSFSSMYHGLDQFSRQFLFTLANDYQLGLPIGVVTASFILRGIFFYANVKGQIAALKMKQMKPYMDKFQQKSRIAQMTRNYALLKSAKQQLKQAQKKNGVDNFYALINLFQIPFLITWFLSLRHVASLPQLFPSVTQSFLWVPDLSTYDPYFILPLISAALSSYSIMISPGLKNAVVLPVLEPFVKYLKFLPLLSLPVTGFFPALINLYWATLAFNQAILMIVMNTSYIRQHYVSKRQQAKPQIIQAVFVEEKPQSKIQSNTTNPTQNQNPKQKVGVIQNAQTLQILKKKPKKVKKDQ